MKLLSAKFNSYSNFFSYLPLLIPLKLISSLGYCRISFSFNYNHSICRENFMKVSSCYLEVEFFIMHEMIDSLLVDYETFVLGIDTMLDSLR